MFCNVNIALFLGYAKVAITSQIEFCLTAEDYKDLNRFCQ